MAARVRNATVRRQSYSHSALEKSSFIEQGERLAGLPDIPGKAFYRSRLPPFQRNLSSAPVACFGCKDHHRRVPSRDLHLLSQQRPIRLVTTDGKNAASSVWRLKVGPCTLTRHSKRTAPTSPPDENLVEFRTAQA
jgi:hypothetical protein